MRDTHTNSKHNQSVSQCMCSQDFNTHTNIHTHKQDAFSLYKIRDIGNQTQTLFGLFGVKTLKNEVYTRGQ